MWAENVTTRLACYDYQHLLYLEHYGGCLDFIGSHIIILSFSFTAVIISFLCSLSSPGWRQARNENANQNLYKHITVRVRR